MYMVIMENVMRKILSILFYTVAAVAAATADEASVRILKNIESSLAALGAYRAEFEMTAGDYTVRGEYCVSGDDFYMKADDTEVYAADGVRREVSASKREIVVDGIDTAARDIVSNPARGFSLLLEDFDSAATTEGGRTCVVLSPKPESAMRETIAVFVDADGKYPTEIVYGTDAGNVAVRLLSVKAMAGDIPRFDAAKYGGYETVDFR